MKLRHYIIVLSRWICVFWVEAVDLVMVVYDLKRHPWEFCVYLALQHCFYQSKSHSHGIGNIYPDLLYTTHFWCLSFASRNEEIVPVGKSHLWHWFCQLCFIGTEPHVLILYIVWQSSVTTAGTMGVKIPTVLFVEFAGSTKCESDLESRATL